MRRLAPVVVAILATGASADCRDDRVTIEGYTAQVVGGGTQLYGGVSPSPRVVQEAMARYLAISNEAPAYSMWQLVEPQVESVRRQLARSFGCDPEEMAITRNASEANETMIFGIDLERGDEVIVTTQNYPRMLNSWEQRVRRDDLQGGAGQIPARQRIGTFSARPAHAI